MKMRFEAFGFIFDFFINNYPEWEWFKNRGYYGELNDNDGYEARISQSNVIQFPAGGK